MSISVLARSSTVPGQGLLHQRASYSHGIGCSTPANGLIPRHISHRAPPLTKTIPPDSTLISPYKILGSHVSTKSETESGLDEGMTFLNAVKAAPGVSHQRKRTQRTSFIDRIQSQSPPVTQDEFAKHLKESLTSPKKDHIDNRHGPCRLNPLTPRRIDRDERGPILSETSYEETPSSPRLKFPRYPPFIRRAYYDSLKPTSSNFIADYFARFPKFNFQPHRPTIPQFHLLSRFLKWNMTNISWERHQLAWAMRREFERIYGKDTKLLAGWQALCRAIGVAPTPSDVTSCQEILRQTHVNLCDLVDFAHTGEPVKLFASEVELSEYTRLNDKFLTMRDVGEHELLGHLLRRINKDDPGPRQVQSSESP